MKGYCQSAASAWKKPGMKTTQVEARMATCVWFIVISPAGQTLAMDHYDLIQFAGDYSQTVRTVAEVASGRTMHKLHSRFSS